MDLYATVREKTRYQSQQPVDARGIPIPFPVKIDWAHHSGHIVLGNEGNGGCYALYDVYLWYRVGNEYKTIPMHDTPYCKTFAEIYSTR